MHKISDIKWVIGKSDTVFFHQSGGLSSTDGLRRIGDVDAVGAKISASLFANINAKNPWPDIEWSGDTLNHRGEWLTVTAVRAPLHDEWSGDWVDIAIPSGWNRIAGAVARDRKPGFAHVWASINSDEMAFAAATDAFILAWGGTFGGWGGQRNIPVRPDVFKRSSAIRLKSQETASRCYVAVTGRRQELVFFDQMTEPPIGRLLETAAQLTTERTETAHAPSAVLDDACAFANAQLQAKRSNRQRSAPVMMVISSCKASIDTDSGSWASPITDGPDDSMSILPRLLRSAVEMAATSEFRYRRPSISSPDFLYLLFPGEETNTLTMARRSN